MFNIKMYIICTKTYIIFQCDGPKVHARVGHVLHVCLMAGARMGSTKLKLNFPRHRYFKYKISYIISCI